MIARDRRHVNLILLSALTLAIPAASAPAATLFETLRERGDEYLAVVSGGYTGEVLFVGAKSLTLYQNVKVDGHPDEVVASTADGCLYVTDREQSLIRVIDPSSAEVIGKISLPPGAGLPHVAVSRDGEVIYIADELAGGIFRIQARRGVYQVGSPTGPGSRFRSIALTSDGERLLLVDYGRARVVVVKANPFGPLAEIPLDDGFPLRISIQPHDKFALITDELLGRVSVLDLLHLVISTKLPVQAGAVDTVIAPDGRSGYVSVWPIRAIFQIDLKAWRSKQITSLPFPPGALDVSPDGNFVLVAERLAGLEHLVFRPRPVAVALVDTRTGQVVRSGEFVADPHTVRFLRTDMPAQPACPGFRNREWTAITADGVCHG